MSAGATWPSPAALDWLRRVIAKAPWRRSVVRPGESYESFHGPFKGTLSRAKRKWLKRQKQAHRRRGAR